MKGQTLTLEFTIDDVISERMAFSIGVDGLSDMMVDSTNFVFVRGEEEVVLLLFCDKNNKNNNKI